MAKTIERAVEMTEIVKFRCTQDDTAQIKQEARKLGLNNSAFLRLVLIQNGIIQP